MQKPYQNTALKALAVFIFILAAVAAVFATVGLFLLSENSGTPSAYYDSYSLGYRDAVVDLVETEQLTASEEQYLPDDKAAQSYYDNSFFGYYNNLVQGRESALIFLLLLSVVLGLGSFIFLMCAAGRHRDREDISANYLDRVPLDLFLALAIGAGVVILIILADIDYTFSRGVIGFPLFLLLVALFALIFLVTLLSCAVRFKMGKWWQNTIIYRLLLRPLAKAIVWLWRKLKLFFGNIALLWKTIILFIGFIIVSVFLCVNMTWGSTTAGILLFLLGIITFLVLCLATIQMNTLRQGAKRMAEGKLDYRVDTRSMFKDFKDHGNNLNRISDGMAAAVDERMKSEHFKTELITNVSHDLKTPLTSIINYVDLLEKEQIDNPHAAEYLEVLSRQSARLKKLTEDLVEASKASTGNIKLELSQTDMKELVRQLMGEYQERFKSAGLESIVNVPEESLFILADGRSLWRIFDNLLHNIYKYAQPQTRVFVDLLATRDKVTLALKNTSRELLNVPADDLMERFVRGDSSRYSEGSGLGLSIARSLTELQNGQLHIDVDGDLFKIKISFDRVYN